MLAWLQEPTLRGLRPGSPEFFAAQKRIILNRPLLEWNYDDWYARFLADARSSPDAGLVVELGSGGGYLKELDPSVITSDLVAGVADRVLDARNLPFGTESVKALFLAHVFHHIPKVESFLNEAQRVLIPGGVISMIEVAHTPFARFVFGRLYDEPYEDAREEWSFPQSDPMKDSNQALSWIVFVRDRAKFEALFPAFQVEALDTMPWLSYLLSGGATARCLVPRWANRLVVALQRMLKSLDPIFSLSWQIRIRKRLR